MRTTFKRCLGLLFFLVLPAVVPASELPTPEFENFLVKFGKENGIEMVNKKDPEVIFCTDGEELKAKSATDNTRFAIKVDPAATSRIYLLRGDDLMFSSAMFIYRFFPSDWKKDEQKWRDMLKLFRTKWEGRGGESSEASPKAADLGKDQKPAEEGEKKSE
jgi:hypothetical protein